MKKGILLLVTVFALRHTAFSQWVRFIAPASDSWVNVHDLDISGDSITIEALISLSNTASCCRNIVSKHLTPNTCNYLLRPYTFEICTSDGFISLTNLYTYYRDTVYHVAATYDGDSVKYFVNGCQTASQAWSGNLVQNNFNTAIGNRGPSLFEQFLGYMDEVRIWNVARTAQQLAMNMHDLPNPSGQTGLLAYYKFNGNYVNAQGNSAWNGVASGTQVSLASNPFFTSPVSSQCACISDTGGIITTLDDTVCPDQPPVLHFSGIVQNVQWQYSTDSVNYTDLVGLTGEDCLDIPTQTSYYRVKSTDENCPLITEPIKIVVDTACQITGISGQFSISSDQLIVSSGLVGGVVEIFNLNGQIVFQSKI